MASASALQCSTDWAMKTHTIYWIHRTSERNETYECYVNCGHKNEMKMSSSQLWLRFKQSQMKSKKCFRGFEPMASALALQCTTNWAMKTHMLGAGQFIEFIVPMKGMKQWILCELKNWYDHRSCDYDLSNRKLSPKNVFQGFESRWSPENIFWA